ncbi:MAG: hypothetical protein GEU90_00675 [Gemmatimonas sp.]|nr:hypothetical protein [Gemmatimonas sp.]
MTNGFQRDYLHELVTDNGDLDEEALVILLGRMRTTSRAPKPAALGVIGKDHITRWMVDHAGVSESSIRYQKKAGIEGDSPYVIEIAFGIREDTSMSRRIVTGLNWSPTLDVPAREIRDILQEMRVDPHDPVVIVVHMARPSWKYTGRGKETVEL